MDEAHRALDEVERMRTAMAARIRLPWWYVVAFAITWTGLLIGPVLSRSHAELGLPSFPYWVVSILLLLVLAVDFRRRSGLHLAERSREYPSLRAQLIPTIAVLGGGVVVAWGLSFLVPPLAALGVGMIGGVLAAMQVRRVNSGIHADVKGGR